LPTRLELAGGYEEAELVPSRNMEGPAATNEILLLSFMDHYHLGFLSFHLLLYMKLACNRGKLTSDCMTTMLRIEYK
jgi:hypothetical protein